MRGLAINSSRLHHPNLMIMKKRVSLSWHSSIKSEGEVLDSDQCSGIGLMLGPITVAKGKNN